MTSCCSNTVEQNDESFKMTPKFCDGNHQAHHLFLQRPPHTMSQSTPARTRSSQNNKQQPNPTNGGGSKNTTRREPTGSTGGRPSKRARGTLQPLATEDLRADNQDIEDHTRTDENDLLLSAYLGPNCWCMSN